MSARHFYEYDGNRYELVGLGKMKCPTTRAWVPSAIYKMEGRDGLFVRESKEFFNTFKFVATKKTA